MDSPHSAPFVFGSNAQAGHAFVPPSASPDPKAAFSTFSPGAPVFGASSPLSSTFASTSTPSPVFQFGSQVPTFGAPSSPYASPSSGQEAPFVFGGAAQQLPAVSPVRGASTRKKVVVARKSPAPSPSVTSLPSSPFAASSSPFSPTTTASPPPFVFGAAASPALDTGKGKEKETPVSPFDLSKRGGEKKGSKGKQPSHGRVVQEQQAFEFKPQLQQEDGRKIVRARRGEAPKANKLTAEAAAGRKIIKARRGAAKAQGQPSGQARGRACLRHSDLFLRHKVGTNQKTLPMSDSLVVKGYTPNGKYLLTYSTHDGIQHRMWYLWREDDTLKTIHDLKWYGFLPGELLFLTNEFIVFLVLGEDGYPVVVQYTLLDMDLALKRDFGAVRGRVKLHDKAEPKPLELCKTLGAQAVFAGLLDEQATLGVVVSTGRERETLVTTFQINPTGLTELGVVQLPAGMYSSPSHLAVHSFPEAHHFMVTYDHTDDPQDQSVLFALHPPTVKEPVRVTHKTLNEDERKHCATFLEPRVKVVNLAGVVLQMPHPTRPLDVISEDVVSATQPGFSLEEFLDFSGDFPEVDFHGTHDRAMSYRVDDSEGEDDDEDDEEDEDDDDDDDDEDEGQYEDDTDEEDYPASEYDYFAGRGSHQSGNEVGGQFSRMSIMPMNEEDSLDNVD